jgi:hypothetical protein
MLLLMSNSQREYKVKCHLGVVRPSSLNQGSSEVLDHATFSWSGCEGEDIQEVKITSPDEILGVDDPQHLSDVAGRVLYFYEQFLELINDRTEDDRYDGRVIERALEGFNVVLDISGSEGALIEYVTSTDGLTYLVVDKGELVFLLSLVDKLIIDSILFEINSLIGASRKHTGVSLH